MGYQSRARACGTLGHTLSGADLECELTPSHGGKRLSVVSGVLTEDQQLGERRGEELRAQWNVDSSWRTEFKPQFSHSWLSNLDSVS